MRKIGGRFSEVIFKDKFQVFGVFTTVEFRVQQKKNRVRTRE